MDQILLLIERYPRLAACRESVYTSLAAIIHCYETSGKTLVCGNGGSRADADHIVGELMKGFCKKRPLRSELQARIIEAGGGQIAERLQSPLRAISLSAHEALGTAFANDVDPVLVYAQQVLGYADANDVLIGISTSGNAQNVIAAGVTAKAMGAVTVGLCGENPCEMDKVFDHVIHVPETETYRVQELHLPVYHAICLAVEDYFFPE